MELLISVASCGCVLSSRDRARCLRRCYSVFRRLLADCVHEHGRSDEAQTAISRLLHDQAAFPASLTQLATALSAPSSSGSAQPAAAAAVGSSAITASSAAVGSEFARQRVSLLGRVSELQSELATRWTDSKRANVALMRDNAALIQQMQHIRAQLKQANSKTLHSTTSNSSNAHSSSRAALDSSSSLSKPAAAAAAAQHSEDSSDGRQREDELRSVIAQQRAQIIALREAVQSATDSSGSDSRRTAPQTADARTASSAADEIAATEARGVDGDIGSSSVSVQ